jgi:hypothetical protein
MSDGNLRRDQLIALMVAERDAEVHDRGAVQVVDWPDDEDHAHQTVELVARDHAGGELAVEHTRIESFSEQIDDRLAIHRYFPRGGPQIPGRDDAGRYILSILPGAVRAVTRRQRRHVVSAVTAWVTENLDRVPWPHTPPAPTSLLGGHPELPFEWALWRSLPDDARLAGPLASVVPIHYVQPPDLENLRVQRLERTLADKVPKLLTAGGGHRRCILVLEDRDSDMSGPLLVSRALQIAAGDRALPDVIYMLYTRGCDPIMGVLYADGRWTDDRDFRWETFPTTRCGQLNAMAVTWA